MRQKKRISQILMIAVLCVFIVYIGLYMNKKKDWITQESRMELSSFLLRQAEMTYLPVFSKVSSGDRGMFPRSLACKKCHGTDTAWNVYGRNISGCDRCGR